MVVTFCGHREILPQKQVSIELDRIIAELIAEGADRFLLGGYGQFDMLAAKAVVKQKGENSNIESVLVIPYLGWNCDGALYDRSLYPPLETVPHRFAISKRNVYMVDAADVVVAYVHHHWGGAAKTLEYAKRKCRRIIHLF